MSLNSHRAKATVRSTAITKLDGNDVEARLTLEHGLEPRVLVVAF